MQKPIRILHVLGNLNRGGAETMIMNLYRNIDKSLIQFDFVIHTDKNCDYNKEIYSYGGNIFTMPRYRGKNHFEYIKSWNSFFKTHPEYHIIHGHMRSTATLYLAIAKKHGLITIAHSHSTSSRGNLSERNIKNLMQFPIRYIADHLLACSKSAGKWLFGEKVLSKDNFKIINNAIEIDHFLFNMKTRDKIRTSHNLGDNLVFGHVGSFTSPKNHEFLIDVFFEIQKEIKNAKLLLIGDGNLKSQIENKVLNLNISNKVIFLSKINNVSDYLQAMDLFLFPSLYEGLGIAVIEAQAAGLPCVVSKNLPSEVEVTDLVSKLPLNSSRDWATHIIDTVLPINKSRVIHPNVLESFNIKSEVEKITSLYLKLSQNTTN